MNINELKKSVSLDGKVAIVTGASRLKGIGFAAAKALAIRGASIVLTDLGERTKDVTDEFYGQGDVSKLDKAVMELKAIGADAIAVPANLLVKADIQKVVDKTIERFGRIDILVNNAAAMFNTEVVDSVPHGWNVSYKVNMVAVSDFTLAVIPYMKKMGGGSVVNTSSGAGIVGVPGMAPYVCSKHGTIGVTKAFAAEYGKDNIRFNAICPGNTWTDNWEEERAWTCKTQGITEEEYTELNKKCAFLNRIGRPSDMGEAIAFLASPAAKYVNGVVLVVDGGDCSGGLQGGSTRE